MLGLGNNLTSASYVGGFSQKYSLEFDGTNDYVDCGNDSSLQFGTGDFSLSMWVKRGTIAPTDDFQNLISYGDDDGIYWYFRFQSANKLFFRTNDSDGDLTSTTSASAITDTTNWHHVAVTFDRDSATGVKIYIDGDLDQTGDHTASSATLNHASDGLLIGIRNSGGSATQPLEGKLDEVAIWSGVALDADAVSAIYNSGTPIALDADDGNYDNSANLQGWWRMGDGKLDSYSLICDEVTPTLGSDVAVNGDLSSNPFAHATNYSGGWSNTTIGNGTDGTATWSSGNQTISCVGDGGGSNRGNATARVTAVSGKVYKVSFTNSATTGNCQFRISNVNSWASGDYLNLDPVGSGEEFYFRSGVSGYVYITFSVVGTGAGSTWTFGNFKVELVNGNAGLMTNMASGDIVEDTP